MSRHADKFPSYLIDYSGEFSHWNFSMHIKRNIDELMANSNVSVRYHLEPSPCANRVKCLYTNPIF